MRPAFRIERDPHLSGLGPAVRIGSGDAGEGGGDVGAEHASRARRHLGRAPG